MVLVVCSTIFDSISTTSLVMSHLADDSNRFEAALVLCQRIMAKDLIKNCKFLQLSIYILVSGPCLIFLLSCLLGLVHLGILQLIEALVSHVNLHTFIVAQSVQETIFFKYCLVIFACLERTVHPNYDTGCNANTDFVFVAWSIQLLGEDCFIERPWLLNGTVHSVNSYDTNSLVIPFFESSYPFNLYHKS